MNPKLKLSLVNLSCNVIDHNTVRSLLKTLRLHRCSRWFRHIQVGMPSTFPRVWSSVGHSHVDTSSYTVCGKSSNHRVAPSAVLTINCSLSTQQFRYVIVQSLDNRAEKLCIAEVAVYEGGLYASMIVFEQQ